MVDSGATHHMCHDEKSFIQDSLHQTDVVIKLGNHSKIRVTEQGIVMINGVRLEALFVPQFRISLLSVSQLDKLGFHTAFSNSLCVISKSGESIIVAPEVGGLYRVQSPDSPSALISTRSMVQQRHDPSPHSVFPTTTSIPPSSDQTKKDLRRLSKAVKRVDSARLWHRRLAHLHPASMKKILGNRLSDIPESCCDTCVKAKHHQRFERTRVPRSTRPFELVHSDLCGPLNHSTGGSTYYIVYVDDCTRYTEVYLLVTKASAEVISKFTHYKAWAESQGYRIKRFRCDNGRGEFNNADFLKILGDSGISYEPSPPYTQHKNGVSERMIQTLNMKARCLLLDANLPMRFWAEAIKTACYIHRRTPTSSLPDGKSPYEMLYGVQPHVYHLRRFGCTVYRHIPKEQRLKFDSRSRPCMMLGYVHKTTKIWRIWDFSGRGRAVECSNVIFKEEENAYDATMGDADAFMEHFDGGIRFPTDDTDNSGEDTDDDISPGGEEST